MEIFFLHSAYERKAESPTPWITQVGGMVCCFFTSVCASKRHTCQSCSGARGEEAEKERKRERDVVICLKDYRTKL